MVLERFRASTRAMAGVADSVLEAPRMGAVEVVPGGERAPDAMAAAEGDCELLGSGSER